MSEFDRICARLCLDLPHYVQCACRYLEDRGKRFCVDFGYQNATELARADWQSRKAERGKK